MKATSSVLALVLGCASVASAHPHFNKTLTVTLGTVEATITYNTTPSNETHAQTAAVGSFVTPRRPILKLSGELNTGTVTLPAGEYTIGVIKVSEKDWVLALYPGRIGRGETPDVAKAIKLDSQFSTAAGTAEHMLIDVTPGHGKQEGKAVLTLHFGTLFLAGVLG
jgi:hypothetical protein